MKNRNRITKSLGLTQEQLAMLLGTTRSRISLFELDLRPLPEAAGRRLMEIIAISNSPDAKVDKKFTEDKEEYSGTFEKMLRANAYEQQILARKITQLEEKQSKGVKGRELLDRLAANNNDKENPLFVFMPPENRNEKYTRNSAQQQLREHGIRLKVLKYEEELLKEAISGKG